jgi:hypothetical protein
VSVVTGAASGIGRDPRRRMYRIGTFGVAEKQTALLSIA